MANGELDLDWIAGHDRDEIREWGVVARAAGFEAMASFLDDIAGSLDDYYDDDLSSSNNNARLIARTNKETKKHV